MDACFNHRSWLLNEACSSWRAVGAAALISGPWMQDYIALMAPQDKQHSCLNTNPGSRSLNINTGVRNMMKRKHIITAGSMERCISCRLVSQSLLSYSICSSLFGLAEGSARKGSMKNVQNSALTLSPTLETNGW